MGHFKEVVELRRKYFSEPYPAGSICRDQGSLYTRGDDRDRGDRRGADGKGRLTMHVRAISVLAQLLLPAALHAQTATRGCKALDCAEDAIYQVAPAQLFAHGLFEGQRSFANCCDWVTSVSAR
jgi:hypothetical protein